MIRNHDSLAGTRARETALDCLTAGFEAADPATIIEETVDLTGGTLTIVDEPYDLPEEVIVIGGGNGAGRMAAALESVLGDRIDRGAVVTDAPADTDRVEILPGDHPVPSRRGVDSARTVLDLAAAAGEETLVLAIVTGGASALLPAPAEGVSLDALRTVTEDLLSSGATIDEINAVRKHCSALKGGRLARNAAPATVVGLVLSDVVGDDTSVIASGPTAPDETTFADAIDVLERYGIDAPEPITTRLERGADGGVPETPGLDDPAFERVTNHVLADALTPLAAASDVAETRGYGSLILSSRVRGEAREAAKTHAAVAEEVRATGNPIEPPAVVCSGGETTVTIRGDGTGGPNQEFALSGAIEIRDTDAVALASVDTDGIDGPTDVAGALVDDETVESIAEAHAALADNDVYPYLDARDALIETGPTGTNLNDLRVVVIEADR